jgi:hypothetical protein
MISLSAAALSAMFAGFQILHDCHQTEASLAAMEITDCLPLNAVVVTPFRS